MSNSTDDKVKELLAKADASADPAHEAWLRAEIEKTLRAKAEGKMGYTSLDDVIAEFGSDAR